jgi:hypothetical protein
MPRLFLSTFEIEDGKSPRQVVALPPQLFSSLMQSLEFGLSADGVEATQVRAAAAPAAAAAAAALIAR